MGNGIDLIKAEIQVAEAQNDLDDSEKSLHTARYNLFSYIGLNPQEQKYTIQFTDSLRAYEERISQQQALNFLEEQPLFKSAAAEAEAVGDRIKSAKNKVFPDMRFDLYKQDFGNGFKYNGFEIGLKFPLWSGLDLKGNIRTAQNVKDQLLWNQQAVKLDLKREVEHAWHGYITSKTTLERYRSTIRGRAEKLQSLTIEAYRLGEIDLLNLINSQQIYLNSQLRYISALRDYFRQMVSLENIDMGSYVAQLQAEVDKLETPPGYLMEFGGTFENQQRAMKHLLLVVPLSLFIIIGLMYLSFGNLRHSLIILMNLPFALSGGIFLLWLRGMYLSVSASIGFIALFGVAVLDVIVLVDHINEIRRKSRLSLRDIVVEASGNRLRPVLMTALVASLGFIPMAFNTGPGSEVQRPLATVVIGGLITSTFLTLMVLPVIYHWIDRKGHQKELAPEVDLSGEE